MPTMIEPTSAGRRRARTRRGFTVIEVAISVAIIAALTALTAAVISGYAVEYGDETQAIWDGVGSFKIACPPGITPGPGVDCSTGSEGGTGAATITISYGSLLFSPSITGQTYTPSVTGATGALTFSYTGDTLPEGVTFNQSNGAFTGPAPWNLRVTQISSGAAHTCAITNTGGVKCWGVGSNGRLGDGTSTTRNTPVDVRVGSSTGPALADIAFVSAGGAHTCALTTGGGVKCWGWNGSGRLGIPVATTFSNVPVDVPGLESGVVSISAGNEHTCAVTQQGQVLCWGRNNFGQLGNGTLDITQSDEPVAVVRLDADAEPEQWEPLTGATIVTAGNAHNCAIANGAALCWGSAANGRAGNGLNSGSQPPLLGARVVNNLDSGATHISAGADHTCAIANGAALCWGAGGNGQIGEGALTTRAEPTAVAGLSSGVTHISAGTSYTCAAASGAALCWGRNANGQLGDGTVSLRTTPTGVLGLTSGIAYISSGTSHTCTMNTSGDTFCWGLNSSSQLGDGGTLQKPSPTPVVGLTNLGWPSNGTVTVTDSTGATRSRAVRLQKN
jgi:prepilin-type N-terminal cleavage/methylation domain-containing protein